MPWLEGGSLRERMDEAATGGKTISADQAREWLLMVLDGLDYLHGRGIYNRDIKVTVIYTAAGVNLDDYGVPLGLGNIPMNVGDCFE